MKSETIVESARRVVGKERDSGDQEVTGLLPNGLNEPSSNYVDQFNPNNGYSIGDTPLLMEWVCLMSLSPKKLSHKINRRRCDLNGGTIARDCAFSLGIVDGKRRVGRLIQSRGIGQTVKQQITLSLGELHK